MLLCSCILLQIAHVIREIRLFQQTPYKIEHIPRVRRTFFFPNLKKIMNLLFAKTWMNIMHNTSIRFICNSIILFLVIFLLLCRKNTVI